MKRRVALLGLVVLTVGGGGGAAIAGADGGPATAAKKKAAKKARVKAVDFEFKAPKVKIRQGGKVIWAFKEGIHNVNGKGFKSQTKSSGKFKYKFKKPGTYKYRCTLHQPDMDGVVRVVKKKKKKK